MSVTCRPYLVACGVLAYHGLVRKRPRVRTQELNFNSLFYARARGGVGVRACVRVRVCVCNLQTIYD